MSRPDAALAFFTETLGAPGVVIDPAAAAPYLVDERALFHGRARAILLPEHVDQLARIMRYCYAQDIPMVPQGGNTGYCGGATPGPDGRAVVIGMSRMRRVRRVDRLSGTLTVEAGLTLRAVQQAAADAGLLFPLSMGSELTCQIGGNLSTNAGGLTVLRYGTARELVLGLEVVLPDGEVLDGLSALRKNNTGYDLKQLFLGAEGTLGIITAAVLKLFPRPSAQATALLAVRDLSAACDVLAALRERVGDCITSFEYFTRESLALVLTHVAGARAPFAEAHRHFVLLELGAGGEADGLREALHDALGVLTAREAVADALLATSDTQRAGWWLLRERIPAGERAAGGSVKHDVAVEIARLPQLASDARRAVDDLNLGCRYSIYGHVGDGNLHFNVLAPPGVAAEPFRLAHGAAISAAVHAAAIALGGSFSAEHGVGQLKRDLLRATKAPAAVALMSRLKAALDPKGLMNPGKVL